MRAIINRYRSSHNQQVMDWLLVQLTKSDKYIELHTSNDYEVHVGLVMCLTSLQEQYITTCHQFIDSHQKKKLQQTRRIVQNGVLKRRLLIMAYLHIHNVFH